ncbi:MAG: hypothetical protein AAF226_09140, partial [Verrucomicrobiota bacterium]
TSTAIAADDNLVSMYDSTRSSSTSEAFDLVIADSMSDPRLTLDSALSAITVVRHTDGVAETLVQGAANGYTIAASGSGFEIRTSNLALNQSLVITYDASLTSAAGPNETVPNTATLDWSSHPDDDQGRDGTQQDDDAHVDTEAFVRFEKVIGETSQDEATDFVTSQGDAVGDNDIVDDPLDPENDDHTDVSIGEIVTYELRLSMGEGTYDNVSIEDILPPGFVFEGASIQATDFYIAGNPSTTLDQLDLSSVVLTESPTGTLTFDFGSLVNPSQVSSGIDSNSVIIEIRARAADDNVLVGGGSSTNEATFNTSELGDNGDPIEVVDIAVVDIVEPELDLKKFVSNQDYFIPGFYGLNDDGDPVTLDDGDTDDDGTFDYTGVDIDGTDNEGNGTPDETTDRDFDGDGDNNDFTIATPGQTLIYRLEAEHTQDSTASAYNVTFVDDIDGMAAEGFGEIVEGSVRVIDLVTGTVLTEGVDYTDNSTTGLLNVELDIPFEIEAALGNGHTIGGVQQRYAVEFLVELTEDGSLLVERGGVDGIDILNIADLEWSSAEENGRGGSDSDAAEVSIVAPDLFITKNDGIQTREPGESYDYTLSYGSKAEHDNGFTEDVGPARNVVIVDTLPAEIDFVSASIVPASIVSNPDGTTTLTWTFASIAPGETGEIEVSTRVKLELPAGEYEIRNVVDITNDFGDANLTDNADFDLDVMSIIAAQADFLTGSNILQGFRFMESTEGTLGEDEDDIKQPILTLMPIYSGLVDPGTVLTIKVRGQFGESLTNGEQTVVADAGGNWLAKMPGLVLEDEPHQIIIEQTRPTWDVVNERHGYNLRTYFAPAISPTHIQSEELSVESVMGRRLAPLPSMQDAVST